MVKTITSESLKTELPDIERWEDEGGQMNEHPEWMTDQPLALSLPGTTASHDRSLQWSTRFTIEPFQPGHGILSPRKKNVTKAG